MKTQRKEDEDGEGKESTFCLWSDSRRRRRMDEEGTNGGTSERTAELPDGWTAGTEKKIS